MTIALKALLSTVNRVLAERGTDPNAIDEDDKLTTASQMVQLCAVHESEIRKASEELVEILNLPEGLANGFTLSELVGVVRIAITAQQGSRT